MTPIVVSALLPAASMRRPSGVSVMATKSTAADRSNAVIDSEPAAMPASTKASSACDCRSDDE